MTDKGQHELVADDDRDQYRVIECSTWPEPFQTIDAREHHGGECPWCGADLETVESQIA